MKRRNGLDADLDRRPSTAMTLSVLVKLNDFNYVGQANRPSFLEHVVKAGRLPAVISLSGCGFPDWLEGVPNNVAMFTVDENSRLLGRPFQEKSCANRDRNGVERALEEKLRFMVKEVQKLSWVDKDRILLSGSGEGAPLVASYHGQVWSRQTLGDPCLIPWSELSTSTPMLMLFGNPASGLVGATRSSSTLASCRVVRNPSRLRKASLVMLCSDRGLIRSSEQ